MIIFLAICVWSFTIGTVVFAIQLHSRPILIFICRHCPVYFSYELLLLLVGKWSGLLALLKTSARRLHPTFSDPLNLKLHSFKVSEQWDRHFDLKNEHRLTKLFLKTMVLPKWPNLWGEFFSRLLDRQSGPEKMAQCWKGLYPEFDITWFLVMGSIWLCSQS